MADAWNEGTWGQGFWGQQSSITVSVTGLSPTTTLGPESFVGDVTVTLGSLQVSSALGTAIGEAQSIYPLTGVASQFNLGTPSIEEGITVTLASLSTSFATGTEAASGTVDAGWGRSTWGSFTWNENIEFFANVSGVTMSTALGTTTQEVGTGVTVTLDSLQLTSSLGTTSQTGTALETLDSLLVGVALSGVTVSGEGSVGVIAPSDQLDFAIGTPFIDIFTQVDPVGQSMTSALGAPVVSADAVVTLGSLSTSFSTGTETVETGTGVIVSVSTVAMSFAAGTAQGIGEAVVNVSGIDLTIVPGNPFSTPWANVVTNASNTWTEVDAA